MLSGKKGDPAVEIQLLDSSFLRVCFLTFDMRTYNLWVDSPLSHRAFENLG